MSTRLLYFAWVKEKTGIAAEEVELPARGDHRCRAHRLAQDPRPRIRPRFCPLGGDQGGDRPDPCAP